MLVLALLASQASAHIPHENVWALAPAPSLNASTPWLLVYLEADQYMMSRSTDGGTTWSMIGGAPLQDEIIDAGQLTDGTVVILSTTAYWYSTDWGDSWTEAALPATMDAMYVSDRVYFGGSGGIWSGSPGGTFTRELSGSAITAFGPGPTAITSTGRVRRRASTGAWSDEGLVAADLTAAAFSSVGLYAGTASGTVYRKTSGTWTACAAIPNYGGDASYPHIKKLGFSGSNVVALPVKHGPVSASSTCASWTDRGTNEDPYFGRSGGATGSEDVWRYFGTSGATWVAAGWQGVTISTDRGVTWDDPQIIPPDTTTQILYHRDFPENPRIWFSRFDATVMYTDDGGDLLDGPSHGLADLNVHFLYTPGDPAYADTVYAIVNMGLYRSDDGGDYWTEVTVPYSGVAQIALWDDPDHFWLLSGPGLSGPVETVDGGGSFTSLTALRSALGSSDASDVQVLGDTAGTEWICVGAQSHTRLVCSEDDGATWSTRYSGSADRLAGFVAVPETGWDRLVLVDDAGVWASDDWGVSWVDVTPFGDNRMVSVERAPDGTLYGACETGRLVRSTDAGDTWEDLGVAVTAWTYEIAPRPDWGDGAHDVLLGTHDGAWVLRDATGSAPTLDRWMDVQRVDDWSGYLRCDGCFPSTADPDAAMDSAQAITSGATAWTVMRGDTLRVYGESAGSASAEIFVDGTSAGTFGGTAAGPGSLLAEVSGLGSGDHLIEVVGVSGTGLYLDFLETDSGSDPIDLDPEVAVSDADGDGYDDESLGGEDCDDLDATVNPAATETWYDGVDQNCDGRNDYDRDGDGYTSSSYGGTDCNDGNPAVRPGVSETWYDGIDQNCDGRNDYDRDGDGYPSSAYGGTDCDDGRSSVNPGRTEIRSNTIDENCNGSLTT